MLVTLLCLVFTWKEYVASKDKFGVIETLKKYPSLCFVFILFYFTCKCKSTASISQQAKLEPICLVSCCLFPRTKIIKLSFSPRSGWSLRSLYSSYTCLGNLRNYVVFFFMVIESLKYVSFNHFWLYLFLSLKIFFRFLFLSSYLL
jgi:hypothetical protein